MNSRLVPFIKVYRAKFVEVCCIEGKRFRKFDPLIEHFFIFPPIYQKVFPPTGDYSEKYTPLMLY